MDNEKKSYFLRDALNIIGLMLFLVYPLMELWPSGWRWIPHQYKYEQMIVGVYATLGVFLIRAAKNPLENASLIWFTVFSSIVHATIMLLQAIFDPSEHGHLYGDIPVLYLIAIVLAYLMPRKSKV
ncbi:DUF6632 domain-containing protein [Criblamydia sequanensis]|uniref:Conserved putative membrane protein n=1 Tax=Candidatus Criblamydia sequanensis CRIB-18 TaxID=1437425 RepID=A0A090D1F3_9BACT|nr:DUF6632 domain-containing protein [Criblamydia sequanensis]CDR33760.1 Conserved putative membrane protein [Criblamydia sequanensis CRIB-18]